MSDIDVQVELQAAPQINVDLLPAVEVPLSVASDIVVPVEVSAIGPAGPQGLQGATGPAGATGATGATGPAGSTGAQGPKGDTGATGATGAQGIQGVKGDKGDTGDTGPAGATGAKGDTGDQGPQGDPGPAGADGTNGTDGADGAAGVVQAIVAGTNVTVDSTDPANPIVSASGGGGGGAVDSVNGQTGVVVLDADDIGVTGTTNKFVTSSDITKLSNLSGTNSGDETTASIKTKLSITTLSGSNTGDQDLSGLVPTTRTVNSKALSSNVTLTQDDVGDGATYKQYSATEKTKLSGIATAATANSSDATLLNRANHTGTQAQSTVTNLVSNLAAKAPLASPTFTGTVSGVTKSMVGLGNVDNTTDLNKPISTATQSALDLKADITALSYAPNRYVENVNLYSIGHSFTNFPNNHSYNQYTSGHAIRVRDRLRLGDFHYHGRGGTWATDMLARLISPTYDDGKGFWTAGAKGIVLLQNYMNEIGQSAAADTLYREMWANSIRGEIAVANSSAIVPLADNVGQTGGWTVAGGSYGVKGIGGIMPVNTTSTAGTVDFTVPSGDEVWVAGVITTTGTVVTPWTASCNGTDLLTFAGEGLKATYDDAVLGSNQTTTTRLVRVSGLNAAAGTTGSKTVRITGQTGGNTILSGVVIPNPIPPRIFLAKEPERGYPAVTNWVDNHVWFENMIDTIASEFDNVHVVDLLDGWDGSIMIETGDAIHPNDIGQIHMADKYVEAINTHITTWDAGVVSI